MGWYPPGVGVVGASQVTAAVIGGAEERRSATALTGTPLLDYTSPTAYVRLGEASYSTEDANVSYASHVQRIIEHRGVSGCFLTEAQTANSIHESENFSTWWAANDATLTGAQPDPEGASTAYRQDVGAGQQGCSMHPFTGDGGAGDIRQLQFWIKAATGSDIGKTVRIVTVTGPGSSENATEVVLTANWKRWRINTNFNTTTLGIRTHDGRLDEPAGYPALPAVSFISWGWCWLDWPGGNNNYDAHYVPSTGGITAASGETLRWGAGVWPAQIGNGRWGFTFFPLRKPIEDVGLFVRHSVLCVKYNGSSITLINSAGTIVVNGDIQGGQLINVIVDHAAGTLDVSGDISGSSSGTPGGTWSTGASLYVGSVAFLPQPNAIIGPPLDGP